MTSPFCVAFQGGIDDIETLVEQIIALVLSVRDQG